MKEKKTNILSRINPLNWILRGKHEEGGSGAGQEQSKQHHPGTSLKLDDILPATRSAEDQTPPPPPQPSGSTPTTGTQPTPAPGEYELGLGALGKRLDKLSEDSRGLVEQLKKANKEREDSLRGLTEAVKELQGQINKKDKHIDELGSQLEMRSSFPALKALAKIRKTVSELKVNPGVMTKEELLDWTMDSIDEAMAGLGVEMIEHSEGKHLDEIPGDQMEALRFEETTDPAKARTVAKSLTPCYFLKNDSKIIVIAKAQLVIFKSHTPTSNTPS